MIKPSLTLVPDNFIRFVSNPFSSISSRRARASRIDAVLPSKKSRKFKMPKWLRILVAPFVFVAEIVAKIFKFIFKPLAPLGRYFKDSWSELKLVRWPTRAETWKMTASVIAFSVVFSAAIMLLDGFFEWIFKTLLGT